MDAGGRLKKMKQHATKELEKATSSSNNSIDGGAGRNNEQHRCMLVNGGARSSGDGGWVWLRRGWSLTGWFGRSWRSDSGEGCLDDSYMDENIQSEKVMMGESGASNSNATSQAQTTESNITKKRRKSTGGRLLDSFRSSLTPKLVQALVCLQDWLRNEKLKQPISVEEDLDKIEQLEQDLASNGKDPSVIVV
uniref:Uncharacterized protein LOC104237553 n=1 Tax=Nicotiana sylvestris TaxID=4096 RepID=A0A1U7XGM6_NICSY|nr:PREDICTED: uncharacterized protein LOC104237553 [Nicotiana sylvestris]